MAHIDVPCHALLYLEIIRKNKQNKIVDDVLVLALTLAAEPTDYETLWGAHYRNHVGRERVRRENQFSTNKDSQLCKSKDQKAMQNIYFFWIRTSRKNRNNTRLGLL